VIAFVVNGGFVSVLRNLRVAPLGSSLDVGFERQEIAKGGRSIERSEPPKPRLVFVDLEIWYARRRTNHISYFAPELGTSLDEVNHRHEVHSPLRVRARARHLVPRIQQVNRRTVSQGNTDARLKVPTARRVSE
jgi:hypothetical protein